MSDIKNWASIIPLDYSTPEETRLEFSIGFLSTDWESLQDLLASPETFLAEKQRLWNQVNEHPQRVDQPVDWTLWTPITMNITPARGSLPAVIKSARSLGVSVSDAQKEAHASGAEGHETVTKMAEILAKKISDLAPDGAYLAEFAPKTFMLKIHYWPPHKCVHGTAASAADPLGTPPTGRHNEPYTKATLGLIGETNVAGTLHFDIGKGSQVRAKFLMDHIENPARTCQKLNSEFDEIFMVNTEFVPEGGTITVRELGPQKHKPINILQTPAAGGPPIDPRAPSVRIAHDATATPDVTFPTINVDGVTPNADPCYICALAEVTDTPTAYVTGNLDLKIYCPTPPPPTPPCGC